MTPEHLAEAAEAASNEASRVLASGRGHPTREGRLGLDLVQLLDFFGDKDKGQNGKHERTLDLR